MKLAPVIALIRRFYPMFNRHKNRWKAHAIIATFITYMVYHMGRRPVAVVKNEWNKRCNTTNDSRHDVQAVLALQAQLSSNVSLKTPLEEATKIECGWKPFDVDTANDLFSVLDSAFLFSYAFSMFVSGTVAEHVDLRIFLTCGLSIAGIFTCLSGVAYYANIHVFAYFVAMQMFAGAFQSTGWPAVVAIMGHWFGKRRIGLIFGLWNTHLYIGNIIGVTLAGQLVEIAWGLSFIVPGLLMITVALLLFLVLVPQPSDIGLGPLRTSMIPQNYNMMREPVESDTETLHSQETRTPSQEDLQQSETQQYSLQPRVKAVSFLRAIRIPGVIDFALTLFCTKFTSYTFMFWLPRYEEHIFRSGAKVSAFISAAFDVGGMLGGVTAGILLDATGSSAVTCAVFILLAFPALLCFKIYGATSWLLNIVLQVFCGAVVDGPYALITTAVSTNLGTHPSLHNNWMAMATVTGIMDGTGSIGAAVGPLVAGPLAIMSWDYVFYAMMIADVMAFLCISRLTYKEVRRLCHW